MQRVLISVSIVAQSRQASPQSMLKHTAAVTFGTILGSPLSRQLAEEPAGLHRQVLRICILNIILTWVVYIYVIYVFPGLANIMHGNGQGWRRPGRPQEAAW